MAMFLMKIFRVIILALNFCLSDFGYRLAHLCFALGTGYFCFGLPLVIFYLVFYFLVLELLVERFVFTTAKRNLLHQDGKHILAMLDEEMDKPD